MNYEEALDFIHGTKKFGSKLGLDNIRRLLNLLGDPQKGLKCIHIAGTNGKGSTSSYIANILQEAGYKVGLFTSPYLERFNERMTIDDEDIPDDILATIVEKVKEKVELMNNEENLFPTEFEIVTAVAFEYFMEEKVDYVVLEVGLGGRLDSTNIIDSSLASVITTIDMDHMDILGDTLGKIAWEKAGIIKKNGLVISYPQKEEALEVLKKVSKEKGAELILCPMNKIKIAELNDCGAIFDFEYNGNTIKNIRINLLGEHQVYNAALALTTILNLRDRDLIKISDEAIKLGMSKTKWKGRLEVLRRNPTFLIDGAHNVQGVKSLVQSLKLFKYNRLILGIGILKDKDVEHMIEILTPLADEIIITEADIFRKMAAEELAEKVKKYNENITIEKNIEKAIDKAFEIAEKDDLILFSGSLYLIGDVRKIVLNR